MIFTFTVVGPAQYCQSSLKLEAYVKLQTPHYQYPDMHATLGDVRSAKSVAKMVPLEHSTLKNTPTRFITTHSECLLITAWQPERVSYDTWCYMTCHEDSSN